MSLNTFWGFQTVFEAFVYFWGFHFEVFDFWGFHFEVFDFLRFSFWGFRRHDKNKALSSAMPPYFALFLQDKSRKWTHMVMNDEQSNSSLVRAHNYWLCVVKSRTTFWGFPYFWGFHFESFDFLRFSFWGFRFLRFSPARLPSRRLGFSISNFEIMS